MGCWLCFVVSVVGFNCFAAVALRGGSEIVRRVNKVASKSGSDLVGINLFCTN